MSARFRQIAPSTLSAICVVSFVIWPVMHPIEMLAGLVLAREAINSLRVSTHFNRKLGRRIRASCACVISNVAQRPNFRNHGANRNRNM